MNNEDILKILNRLSEIIANLPNENIQKFLDGTYEIKFVKAKNTSEHNEYIPSFNANEIIDKLKNLDSRENAKTYLGEQGIVSKKDLEVLARQLDIPIVKTNKVDDLKTKIIEFTVGAKLRSQTIQDA